MLPIEIQKVTLTLKLTCGVNFPSWKIPYQFEILKEQVINDDEKLITVEFFTNNDSIELEYYGRTPQDTVVRNNEIIKNQNLKIENLLINDVKIELLSIRDYMEFVPVYDSHRITYAKQNKIDLPTVIHTSEMFDNGTWTLKFSHPFFVWYNKVILGNLDNLGINIWIKRAHLGLTDQKTLNKIVDLLDKL